MKGHEVGLLRKTYVTGPLDPAHGDPIGQEETRVIIRHYQGESLLRKVQRWIHEHLRFTDKSPEKTAT